MSAFGDEGLSFEGWVMSHFKAPWKRFEAMSPWTPQQSDEVIEERTRALVYHNIDSLLLLGAFGAHAWHAGAYAATNTLHFYRVAQLLSTPARFASAAPVIIPAAAAVGGAALYIDTMENYAPEDPKQSSSFWRSIAAAMSGGMSTGGWSY